MGRYRVLWRRRWRSDPLSGLRLRLAEAEGRVDDMVVWRVVWRGGYYEAVFPEGLGRLGLETCRVGGGRRLRGLRDFCLFILPQGL